jgi:hypothetical protein
MLTENPLDLGQIAYLCGGPRRAALTTLLTLIQHRAIAVAPGPGVATVDCSGSTELERAVLKAIPPGGVKLADLVDAVAQSAAMTELRTSLVRRGFLTRWRIPTLHGLRMRRHLRDTARSGLPRIAVVGPQAITDERLRGVFTGTTRPAGRSVEQTAGAVSSYRA